MNNTTQKGGLMLWLIVLIIILGGAVYIKYLKQQIAQQGTTTVQTTTTTQTGTNGTTGTTQTTTTACGLTVTSPVRGATVRFPLTVSGKIDNSNSSGCHWTMFEGQAGLAQLSAQTQGAWHTIAGSVVKVADWTSNSTTFTLTLTPDTAALSSLTSGTPLKLTFMMENPSGDPARDRFIDYPLSY